MEAQWKDKAKNYNRFINYKEKRIITYCYRRSSIQKKVAREEKRNKKTTKHQKITKWHLPNPYLSIITLNINKLNYPVKSHWVAGWIKKQKLTICCLQETHFSVKDTHKLQVKIWKKIFYINLNQKKTVIATLVLDKIDFKQKAATRNKCGHFYIMIRLLIYQENITDMHPILEHLIILSKN